MPKATNINLMPCGEIARCYEGVMHSAAKLGAGFRLSQRDGTVRYHQVACRKAPMNGSACKCGVTSCAGPMRPTRGQAIEGFNAKFPKGS